MMGMSKSSLFAANESAFSLLKRGDGGAPKGLHVKAG